MELTLSRETGGSRIILDGWDAARAPQLVIRERQHGHFLTANGWQARSGVAPLITLPDRPGAFLLDVDGNSLAPGARVNLEVDVLAKYTERLLATSGVAR